MLKIETSINKIGREEMVMRHKNLKIERLKQRLNTSFAKGVGSVVAVEGRIVIPDGITAKKVVLSRDAQAIASDWKRVGNQIRIASRKIR